jgi:hypothetical protein
MPNRQSNQQSNQQSVQISGQLFHITLGFGVTSFQNMPKVGNINTLDTDLETKFSYQRPSPLVTIAASIPSITHG